MVCDQRGSFDLKRWSSKWRQAEDEHYLVQSDQHRINRAQTHHVKLIVRGNEEYPMVEQVHNRTIAGAVSTR